MQLAYVMATGRGETDLVLTDAAMALMAQGLELAGVMQTNTDCPGQHHCDMDVRVLPDGPEIRISQSLGAGSRGCRLDPSALETAVALVGARMQAPVDALIVNKFGKHEAEGRGFRDVIAEALGRGLPVVLGVNGLNLAAFLAYAGDAAVLLPPEPAAIADWVLDARAAVEAVA